MMESTFRRCRGDGGFVGGAEGILFGIAVVVVGALLVYNAWAVVDAKMAASSAAREAVRFYVESDGDQSAASAVGRDAFGASTGLDPSLLEISINGSFERCSRITAIASYRVPAIRLPFGAWGEAFLVTASHSELVDPYRSGLRGSSACD